MPDLAIVHAGQLATCDGDGVEAEDRLGLLEDGALLVDNGKVTWVGTSKELSRRSFGKPRRTLDAGGRLVTPGFVDPHSHLAFAGSREEELERKISGESYTKILKSGGGILRTMRETREASAEKIADESGERVKQLLMNGVTTVEVKSGYGLDLKSELKLLDAIGRLQKRSPIELIPTFLGLHARPPEFRTNDEFVKYSLRKMLPAVAQSAARPRFSDCFCEEGVFSRDDCMKYLRVSRELGFACKIHADEFSDSGGASLAAEARCVSAEHLGKSDHAGIESMANAGVVAVLLPGTSFYSSIPYAEAQFIAQSGCTVALGTDLSPNSWVEAPQFVMSLACSGMRMTPAQALLAHTRGAAAAVARDDLGTLSVGSQADFVIHSYTDYRFIPYRAGGRYVRSVFKRGREIYRFEEP